MVERLDAHDVVRRCHDGRRRRLHGEDADHEALRLYFDAYHGAPVSGQFRWAGCSGEKSPTYSAPSIAADEPGTPCAAGRGGVDAAGKPSTRAWGTGARRPHRPGVACGPLQPGGWRGCAPRRPPGRGARLQVETSGRGRSRPRPPGSTSGGSSAVRCPRPDDHRLPRRADHDQDLGEGHQGGNPSSEPRTTSAGTSMDGRSGSNRCAAPGQGLQCPGDALRPLPHGDGPRGGARPAASPATRARHEVIEGQTEHPLARPSRRPTWPESASPGLGVVPGCARVSGRIRAAWSPRSGWRGRERRWRRRPRDRPHTTAARPAGTAAIFTATWCRRTITLRATLEGTWPGPGSPRDHQPQWAPKPPPATSSPEAAVHRKGSSRTMGNEHAPRVVRTWHDAKCAGAVRSCRRAHTLGSASIDPEPSAARARLSQPRPEVRRRH